MSYYSAARDFHALRRLTGFGFTRNIIRIRTMRRAVGDAWYGA
jgi:hypothetical protein